MNKIKTKKHCKSMDNESPYNETEMSPLTKDIRCLKLLELKVVLQKNSYIDAMKFSTSDFITEEYEEDVQEDDFSNTRDRKKGIAFEPYKSDLISSNIESYNRKKFKNTKCKNFVVLNGSVEASTGKLQVQSKNLQRRQNLSEQSNKVLKEELITNVRKIQQYSINRRKESLLLSEDSAKDELHKTENKKVSLRNSSPAVKSLAGTQQIAEKEKSKQARRKSTKIELEPEEEDDPNKLWCICRQPHNNRFMIMCDYCDDWFHGNCVGISKQKGRQLEELQQEWICPKCEKKGRGMYVNFFLNSM